MTTTPTEPATLTVPAAAPLITMEFTRSRVSDSTAMALRAFTSEESRMYALVVLVRMVVSSVAPTPAAPPNARPPAFTSTLVLLYAFTCTVCWASAPVLLELIVAPSM